MKIVIAGTRGIPARYGGFETFAEQLSTRLVDLGFDVTVIGRRKLFSKNIKRNISGVKTWDAPTIFHKYLETPVASLTTFLKIRKSDADIILLCNAANSPFVWLANLKKIPTVINVDGIERRRKKWNIFGKIWYILGELFSVYFAHSIIADADVIADYYRKVHKLEPEVIAYGATVYEDKGKDREFIAKFNLLPDDYILYVSRIEPENNALGVIEAYVSTNLDMPLVIVGDAPYSEEYKKTLREKAKGRDVRFLGYQYGDMYASLQRNAYIYIQATEVGGTHPALVESMAYENCIIANRTPEHTEVLGEAGLYYDFNDFEQLANLMESLVDNKELVHRLRKLAITRAGKYYSWDSIVTRYVELFIKVTGVKVKSINEEVRIPSKKASGY